MDISLNKLIMFKYNTFFYKHKYFKRYDRTMQAGFKHFCPAK